MLSVGLCRWVVAVVQLQAASVAAGDSCRDHSVECAEQENWLRALVAFFYANSVRVQAGSGTLINCKQLDFSACAAGDVLRGGCSP